MDRTVPPSVAVILDFIRQVEVGRQDRASYDVVYGHNKTARPITSMTVDQWIDAGPGWTRKHKSSAAGGYQFMNATLKDLKRELGLRGEQVMTPDLQDRLAYHLLKRREYEQWARGEIGDVRFANRLAMEWASLPVLSKINGKQIGQSYYAGDGLNKVLTSVDEVRAVLAKARLAAEVPPTVVEQKPKPEPGKTDAAIIGIGLLAAIWSGLTWAGDWIQGVFQ